MQCWYKLSGNLYLLMARFKMCLDFCLSDGHLVYIFGQTALDFLSNSHTPHLWKVEIMRPLQQTQEKLKVRRPEKWHRRDCSIVVLEVQGIFLPLGVVVSHCTYTTVNLHSARILQARGCLLFHLYYFCCLLTSGGCRKQRPQRTWRHFPTSMAWLS